MGGTAGVGKDGAVPGAVAMPVKVRWAPEILRALKLNNDSFCTLKRLVEEGAGFEAALQRIEDKKRGRRQRVSRPQNADKPEDEW